VSDTIDLEIAPVTTGTSVSLVTVPAGSFSSVTLDIEDTCGGLATFSFSNASGPFTLPAPQALDFAFPSLVSPGGHSVSLDLTTLVQALSGAMTTARVRAAVNSFHGTASVY
jgi:hypothetical protein